MRKLLSQIRSCTLCQAHLPLGPRPIIQASASSKIMIIGQAPGTKVHASGVPWNDASGMELRRWLGVPEEVFYDESIFALMPMGFCYPGKGSSGDLPPRAECAPEWHRKVLKKMEDVQLTLLIGQYAQKYYLGEAFKPTLTDNVKNYKEFLPSVLPLIHPSPRNRIWQKKNPWFEKEVIPHLQKIVRSILP